MTLDEAAATPVNEIENDNENTWAFKRKHRWTIESEHLLSYLATAVSFEYTAKKIYFEAHEMYNEDEIPIITWAEGIENNKWPEEKLVFTTYDGCGQAIDTTTFEKLKIVKRTSAYKYSDNNVATQKFEIEYQSMDRKFVFKPNEETTIRLAEAAAADFEI